MDGMQAQMEKLMKVVETTVKAEAKPFVKELSMKLVPLLMKDDIEAYLCDVRERHIKSRRITGHNI